MRMLDDDTNRPLDRAWLYLSSNEALLLLEHLRYYFGEESDRTDWHTHIESEDGTGKEVTVAIYDPAEPQKDERWEAWFRADQWTPDMFETPSTERP